MDKTFTNRYEIKYLLKPNQYLLIKQNNFNNMLVSDINKNYYIQSIYFDSPNYRYYSEKIEGMTLRSKPRLRIYRNNQREEIKNIFLEFKHRYNKIVKKERVEIDIETAKKLLYGKFDQFKDINHIPELLRKFYYLTNKYCLKPSINILYNRAAFYGSFYPNLRITFDSKIQSSLSVRGIKVPSTSLSYVLNPKDRVLEIKYNDKLPNSLLNYIETVKLEQLSFSKYAYSLEKNYTDICSLLR